MKIVSSVASLILIAIAFPGGATPLLQNYSAEYVVKYDGIPLGKSTTSLAIQKNHYRLCVDNVTTAPFIHGSESECSQGLIINNQTRPLFYSYQYMHNGNKQNINITFDWQKYHAIMQTNHSKWQTNISPGTQDKLSYQLDLREGLTQAKTNFIFPVADGGTIKTYQYHVVGQEKVTTPLQTYMATKVERLPMPHKETVVLWMAPVLNYIPVRIDKNKNIVDIGSAEITAYHA